jgi:hypothetical protein
MNQLTHHHTQGFFNDISGDYTFTADAPICPVQVNCCNPQMLLTSNHHKEHSMTRRIKLTIQDTLAFYNDSVGDYTFNPDYPQTAVYWFALPQSAFDGDDLLPQCQEPLLQAVYGPKWRSGNDDGSKYIVLNVRLSLPTPEEERTRPWLAERVTCLLITEDGLAQPVGAREF